MPAELSESGGSLLSRAERSPHKGSGFDRPCPPDLGPFLADGAAATPKRCLPAATLIAAAVFAARLLGAAALISGRLSRVGKLGYSCVRGGGGGLEWNCGRSRGAVMEETDWGA